MTPGGDNIARFPPLRPRPGQPNPWLVVVATVVLVVALRLEARGAVYALSADYLRLQDRWLLLIEAGVLALATVPLGRWALPVVGPRAIAGIAVALALAGWVGHWTLFCGYDLSRDEQMAVFDTRIYAAGRAWWPLPPGWQRDAGMLNLLFMLPVDRPVAWVSGYLPGNSLIRAGVGWLTGDPAWTGGLLNAGSVVLVWRLARRWWPQDDGAVTIAVAVLALSGQIVFAGMTAFAMPTHLFCSLLWLWLFLKDRPGADVAAIAVAFVATGVHQPLFHPMFAGPWLMVLAWRCWRGEAAWARLAAYGVAYVLITGLWFDWPHVTQGWVSGPLSVAQPGTSYLDRLRGVLAHNGQNVAMVSANLLRFCTWQALPAVPLLVAGVWAAVRAGRRDPEALALLAGVLLPIAFFTAALPYQGHGFGYRYLHQVMGNVALLSGGGWRALGPWRARLETPLVRAFALSLLVVLPVQAWFAHGLYAPFAALSARLDQSGADYAIVGADDAPYALDLVLNRPDLSNRPIRLSAGEIDDGDALAARLCDRARPGRVAVALPADAFFAPALPYFHAAPAGLADARFPDMARAFREGGCRVLRLTAAQTQVLAPE